MASIHTGFKGGLCSHYRDNSHFCMRQKLKIINKMNKIKIRVGGNGDKINNYRVWDHSPQNKINKINKMNKIIPWCDGKKIK